MRHDSIIGNSGPHAAEDPTDTRTDPLGLAIRWFVHSGIRNSILLSDEFGSYNAYYNRHHGYPFAYSEITGYAVSLLIALYQWFGREEYREAAVEAARYLGRVAARSPVSAFPHSMRLPARTIRQHVYAFDVAICITGLMHLHREVADSDMLATAVKAADWLLRMQAADGSFRALFDVDAGKLRNAPSFFGDACALHAKNSIGLYKLWEATGDDRYRKAAIAVGEWALRLQDGDGAFPVDGRRSWVFTHGHCYATEAMLFLARKLGDADFMRSFLRAASWLAGVQNPDGSLSQKHKRPSIAAYLVTRKVCDASAQSVRIWAAANAQEAAQKYQANIAAALRFLERMQHRTDDARFRGGLPYEERTVLGWRSVPHNAFSWPTMFYIHALHLIEAPAGNLDLDEVVEELF